MKYEVLGYPKRNVASPRVEISQARYEEIKNAKAVCIFALELEEKLDLLLDNYSEFEVELLGLSQAWLLRYNRDLEASMQERLTLDRRLVNLLTACRLYLDQTEHGISRIFGNPSGELTALKKFKNGLYDNHWGYRFMEALRNHVQHAGLPVHRISYNRSRSTGKGPDYTQHTVIPHCKIATLADDDTFKPALLKELQERGEEAIDLRQPTREYVSCLIQLHDRLRDMVRQRVEAARRLYEAAMKEFSCLRGEDVKYPYIAKLDENGKVIEKIDLVDEFLSYYDNMVIKNRANHGLHTACASNSDQQR